MIGDAVFKSAVEGMMPNRYLEAVLISLISADIGKGFVKGIGVDASAGFVMVIQLPSRIQPQDEEVLFWEVVQYSLLLVLQRIGFGFD